MKVVRTSFARYIALLQRLMAVKGKFQTRFPRRVLCVRLLLGTVSLACHVGVRGYIDTLHRCRGIFGKLDDPYRI